MDLVKNKETVSKFFQLLNEQKLTEAFELLHEEIHWWILGSLPISGNYDKRKISLALKMLYRNFTGFTFILHTLTAEEDRVSVLAESKATHKKTQKQYNNHYHFLFTLKDNKLISNKEFFDTIHAAWIEE